MPRTLWFSNAKANPYRAFVEEIDINGTVAYEALEVISLLAKMKQSLNSTYSPWSFLAEVISNMEPLVCLLANGSHSVQDKVIEIISGLCADQPILIGDLLAENSRTIGALDIIKQNSGCYTLEADARSFANRTVFHDGCEFDAPDPGYLLGGAAGMWLLSILSSFGEKRIVVVAGGLEVLSDKLANYTSNS
ncbi:hypothetical protein L1987_29237 [Smallanthus sonchifolius]|uniref:Uncharacterized protein n=1 Tax=Smallanthus sonchifolius TaxID=185202 RepID=A0ACB9HZD7_9ASTR|nr:hypothetical protein L1987_29237 [Smallanthus sonchifolius]